MITIVTLSAKQCTCDCCSHVWLTFSPNEPQACPACRSKTWNGVKPRPIAIKFPGPRKPGRPRTMPEQKFEEQL